MQMVSQLEKRCDELEDQIAEFKEKKEAIDFDAEGLKEALDDYRAVRNTVVSKSGEAKHGIAPARRNDNGNVIRGERRRQVLQGFRVALNRTEEDFVSPSDISSLILDADPSFTKSTTNNVLSDWKEDGKVKKAGRGQYRPTEEFEEL